MQTVLYSKLWKLGQEGLSLWKLDGTIGGKLCVFLKMLKEILFHDSWEVFHVTADILFLTPLLSSEQQVRGTSSLGPDPGPRRQYRDMLFWK